MHDDFISGRQLVQALSHRGFRNELRTGYAAYRILFRFAYVDQNKFVAAIHLGFHFNGIDLAFMPRLEDTFDLYTKMLLGMGVVFQMPTVVYFLAKMKLVTARFLWQHGKYAILIAYIIAAVVTPTGDPMNQTIFAAPMIVLYFLSIIIAWIVNPRSRVDKTES